jgi:rRNA small subunit pseudouridine methyltransferase Nep1
MAVLDSPLNKAGKVKLYIHTDRNVLIEVNPKCRIPRTFKRFSGLIVQLLHLLKIRSSDGSEMLLKVIKSPFSRHIPAGARCFAMSQHGSLYNPNVFVQTQIPDDAPIVLIFGAMATGSIEMADHPYVSMPFYINIHFYSSFLFLLYNRSKN